MTQPAALPDDKPKLGIFYDIPEDVYHKSPGISKHMLDKINQSCQHYLAAKANPWSPTQPMIVGSAFHCATLEPQNFDNRFVVNREHKDFRKNVAKDWKQEQISLGKNILSISEYDNVMRMVEAIRKHPYAGVFCNPDAGKPEVTCFAIDNNAGFWDGDDDGPTFRLCRSRADFLNFDHEIIVDLKKAECAGFSAFQRHVNNYRYHVQDVMYRYVFKQGGFRAQDFLFVVVEPEPPYGIRLYSLAKTEWRRKGVESWKRDMRRYNDMLKLLDTDPEYTPPCYDEPIETLDMPSFAKFETIY